MIWYPTLMKRHFEFQWKSPGSDQFSLALGYVVSSLVLLKQRSKRPIVTFPLILRGLIEQSGVCELDQPIDTWCIREQRTRVHNASEVIWHAV